MNNADNLQSTIQTQGQNSNEEIHGLFARLNPRDVEQFYKGYQLWSLHQHIETLQLQIEVLQQEIAQNAEQMQQFHPSPMAQATLAQFQASGVTDIDLLERMLERGDTWLDHTMQLLAQCERLDIIHDNYTEWCEHALEGAYDWLASMNKAEISSPPSEALTPSDEPFDESTEQLLLQKLMSEEDEPAKIPTIGISHAVSVDTSIATSVTTTSVPAPQVEAAEPVAHAEAPLAEAQGIDTATQAEPVEAALLEMQTTEAAIPGEVPLAETALPGDTSTGDDHEPATLPSTEFVTAEAPLIEDQQPPSSQPAVEESVASAAATEEPSPPIEIAPALIEEAPTSEEEPAAATIDAASDLIEIAGEQIEQPAIPSTEETGVAIEQPDQPELEAAPPAEQAPEEITGEGEESVSEFPGAPLPTMAATVETAPEAVPATLSAESALEEAPAEPLPIEDTIIKETPAASPIDTEAATEETPAEPSPIADIAVEVTPVEPSVAEDTTAEDTPEELPAAEDISIEEILAEPFTVVETAETPVNSTVAEETPVEDEPSEMPTLSEAAEPAHEEVTEHIAATPVAQISTDEQPTITAEPLATPEEPAAEVAPSEGPLHGSEDTVAIPKLFFITREAISDEPAPTTNPTPDLPAASLEEAAHQEAIADVETIPLIPVTPSQDYASPFQEGYVEAIPQPFGPRPTPVWADLAEYEMSVASSHHQAQTVRQTHISQQSQELLPQKRPNFFRRLLAKLWAWLGI